MLNEKALRKKLQELGIPTWGSKPQLIRRHQEWLNLYNSNCDAADDLRKTKRELLKELDEWERIQGASAIAKESQIMRKDFDGQNYATTHKSQFDDLIASARNRAKANAKARDEKGNVDQTQHNDIATSGSQLDNTGITYAPPPHPYEDNEVALSSIRQKVEEANRTDSTFPPLDHATGAASLKAGQNVHPKEVLLGFAGSPEPFGGPTRKVPMFRMPEDPVVDVDNSTTMQ